MFRMETIVIEGDTVYVLDKKLGYGLTFLLNIRPLSIKHNGNRAIVFKYNKEFRDALDYMLKYNNN